MTALPPAFFFIHVMKTAGGTFLRYLLARFGPDACFPVPKYDGHRELPYMKLRVLRDIPMERHRRLSCYAGHFPYCATAYVERELITATILRDPVERIVSYLRVAAVNHPIVKGWSYEDIYDHPDVGPRLIHNHQVKVFALTTADQPNSVLQVIDVDAHRLDIAKRQLAEVDIVGRQENFGAFLSVVGRRLGWDEMAADVAPLHVGVGEDASPELRRRIRDDNAADIAFYEHALGLMDEQGTV